MALAWLKLQILERRGSDVKRQVLIFGLFLSMMVSLICVPLLLPADVEWTIKRQLNLNASPLDISTSIDGQWIFILAQGEVLVYSIPEDKVVNRIPVDEAFDRLTHSAKSNTLILSSQTAKTVRIIQLEVIHNIVLTGLPFKGSEHARVTMAVFGDYQ